MRDAWPEAWDFNGKMLANCRAGHPQVFQNAHFVLERDGLMRDSWFDLYYAPVGGGGGAYEGVMATVVEITDRVLAEQANAARATELRKLNTELDTQRARLEIANRRLAGDMAFLNNLFQSSPSFFAVLIGPDHRFELTNAAYDELIQKSDVHGKPVREVLPEIAEQGFLDLLDRVYHSGEPFHGQNVEVMLAPAGSSVTERRILDFMYQPLKNADGLTYGILVEGIDVTRATREERLRVGRRKPAGSALSNGIRCARSASCRTPTGACGAFAPALPVTDELRSGPARRFLYVAQRRSPLWTRSRIRSIYTEFPIRRADTGERRLRSPAGARPVDTQAGSSSALSRRCVRTSTTARRRAGLARAE
ncbi:hypothetical protein AB595_10990 [Massilia sp. WF1]|uniref:PAS domain-containing protein n=1 Tax=Massilia sp. WF1 TaxID=1406431 RepID=UPI00064B17E9|nr:PAS domain-containing protein [Massilia sp. WF1]KLU36359.2 hypothetical protein AB595_10990 [Massilia sp. WF1]